MSLQKTNYDIPLVWDAVPITDLDHYEVWRAPYLPIIAINQGLKQIAMAGVHFDWFKEIGDSLIITGSTGNDGTYTIANYGEVAGNTVITVDEAIPSAVADGWAGKAVIDQLANKGKKPAYTDKEMPVGFYYYVIYAVDDQENFSDPTDPIIRFSPLDYTAPATPTGLTARRNAGYETVDLKWNSIEDETLKGYIISRTLDPRTGSPTWEVIALTSSSNYKDNEIPLDNDAALRMTEVAYSVQSYDKSGNVSVSTAATYIFTIPLITGLRTSLDFDAINVFWDLPLPEDGMEAVAIFFRKEGTAAWTFDGAVPGTSRSHRINGPLLIGRKYEVAITVATSDIHTIVRVGTGPPHEVYIAGDFTTLFTTGDQIGIIHSAQNDGVHTIGTVTYTVETKMLIPAGIVQPPNMATVDQALGYFGITGDVTADWAGDKIFIYAIAFGQFTIDRVTFDGVNTRLYTEETIPAGDPGGRIYSGQIVNLTTAAFQVPTNIVSIPEYETDTTEPTPPFGLLTTLDPQPKKVFLNWSRVTVEDDFLEFYIDISLLATDFPITAISASPDKFTVAGDQSAYFVTGDRIYSYGGTNNNGWWTITNVSVIGGPNTEITVDAQLNAGVVDGNLMSDRAWWNLDKTRNTNFQAFYNYIIGDPYRFRIRAVDRSGNLSDPVACTTAIVWDNLDLTGGGTDPLMLPQWVDYTESQLTTYKNANMRRYALMINDGPSISEFFRRYVLFIVNRPWTPNPQNYFNNTKDEIMGRPTFNTHNYDSIQLPNTPITVVNQGTKTFTIVGGDFTAYFQSGDTFRISGSTGNDQNYAVSSSTYVPGPNTTEIITVNPIPDPTVDGQIDWSLFIWPAIEDTFRSVWVGPTTSIRDIPAT